MSRASTIDDRSLSNEAAEGVTVRAAARPSDATSLKSTVRSLGLCCISDVDEARAARNSLL
ncbi:MAG: hypothetical protein R3B36_22510 [Polyangiaceae bacterium]